MVNQLCLVKILVEELHHLIPDLHPDADIHGSRRGVDSDFAAFGVKPVCALPSDGRNDFAGVESLALIRLYSHSLTVFQKNFLHHGIEFQHHARVFQMMLQLLVNLVALFRSQMADGTFHQF